VAFGRVLATPVVSDVDVPGFDRATMDGYAVVAVSTEGAAAYSPLPLTVIGDSMPGHPFTGVVAPGQAVRVMTGAPMPHGADAVLPPSSWNAERAPRCQRPGAGVAREARRPPWRRHRARHDRTRRGPVLRPQDVGVLSSIGQAQVDVVRQPRVRLAITGNELQPAGSRPEGFRIADANGPMLAALVRARRRRGGLPRAAARRRRDDCGGAPCGRRCRDRVRRLERRHRRSGALARRPRRRAGGARHRDAAEQPDRARPHRPPAGVPAPGNPVSSLCAYDFFAGRAIRVLGGRAAQWPYRIGARRLARKISSPIGRLDYARVTLVDGLVEPLAVAGASLLSSTTRPTAS
jgi:molybdopterin molybdotransferase